jgi:alpha-1,3-rhamnosyl/mannosyltransferase
MNTPRLAFGTSILRQQRATGQLDGIGRYAEELLAALGSMPEFRLQEYMHADIARTPVPGALEAGPFRRQAFGALAWGGEFGQTARSFGDSVGLVHATDHFIPHLRRTPVVATIHDAIPLSHPEWNRYRFRRLKGLLWKRSARWADHIITVSDHAKENIARWFGLAPDRIAVTPLGVSARWFAPPDPAHLARVRAACGLGEKYFLFLGVMQPRKNVARLLAAHRLLPAGLRREIPLVAAGPPGWDCAREEAAFADGEAGALRQIGQMNEDDLLPLVQGATALVLPSLHEGFGLPVLEAFAAGTPVIASNAGALPEVAGDAALLAGPLDIGAWAEALRRIADQRELRDTLRARGRERARQFTWQRTAELTADVYRRALRGKLH